MFFLGGGGGWGEGGNESFPKLSKSFVKSFAKILAKFHELKVSKKTTTLNMYASKEKINLLNKFTKQKIGSYQKKIMPENVLSATVEWLPSST